MCLHMYNNMLSSNKAYILLYHVWPHLISTGEIIFNIRWEESRNSTNSFYVGGNWGSEIQLLDLGHTAGYLRSQDLSFPAISAKSQFPLALLLNLIWQFILRPGWLFPKVWEPGIISVWKSPEKEVVMHMGTPLPNQFRRPKAVLEEKRSLAGERDITKGKCPNFPTSDYAHPTFYFVLKLLSLQSHCREWILAPLFTNLFLPHFFVGRIGSIIVLLLWGWCENSTGKLM